MPSSPYGSDGAAAMAPAENMNGTDVTNSMTVMKIAIDLFPIDENPSAPNKPDPNMMTLLPCDPDDGDDERP
jgi:hypothetical protein